ncbi:unnamed protein product [Amoebophrya sp. A25]|nr:unnamed protein product [Amoebophrya sp. A25]|eukprot:GSA25T00016904001.1
MALFCLTNLAGEVTEVTCPVRDEDGSIRCVDVKKALGIVLKKPWPFIELLTPPESGRPPSRSSTSSSECHLAGPKENGHEEESTTSAESVYLESDDFVFSKLLEETPSEKENSSREGREKVEFADAIDDPVTPGFHGSSEQPMLSDGPAPVLMPATVHLHYVVFHKESRAIREKLEKCWNACCCVGERNRPFRITTWSAKKLDASEEWSSLWAECRDHEFIWGRKGYFTEYGKQLLTFQDDEGKRNSVDMSAGGYDGLLRTIYNYEGYSCLTLAILNARVALPAESVFFPDQIEDGADEKSIIQAFVTARHWDHLSTLFCRENVHKEIMAVTRLAGAYAPEKIRQEMVRTGILILFKARHEFTRYMQVLQTILSNGKYAGVRYAYAAAIRECFKDKHVAACLHDRANTNQQESGRLSYWRTVLKAVGEKRSRNSEGIQVYGTALWEAPKECRVMNRRLRKTAQENFSVITCDTAVGLLCLWLDAVIFEGSSSYIDGEQAKKKKIGVLVDASMADDAQHKGNLMKTDISSIGSGGSGFWLEALLNLSNEVCEDPRFVNYDLTTRINGVTVLKVLPQKH